MTLRRWLPLLLVASLALPARGADDPEVDRTLLDQADKDLQRERYESAATRLWRFMKSHPKELPEYERAEFHLAEALDALKYPHAAEELWINVGQGRRDARLLGPALSHLSEGVQRRPYDAGLVTDRLLADTEFGFVPEGADDFVKWHQGLVDLELGYHKWGKERLDGIDEGSSWWYTSRYFDAVRRLAADDVDRATKMFEELDEAQIPSPTLTRDVRLTLARLAYERGEWKQALKYYESTDIPLQDSGPILLERAWCYYRLGESSKALGLLAALDAPVFRDFEDPERYLLTSLVYKDLCHFDAALASVEEFRRRFKKTLQAIYAREDLVDDDLFVSLALRVPEVRDRQDLRDDLASEQRRLKDAPGVWKRTGLTAFLQRIYTSNAARADREFRRTFREYTEGVGDSVLDAEEQMNVVEYEIELARNRRAKDPAPPEPGELLEKIPAVSNSIFYRFDGEYWTDEIEDLRVVIESKCEETP